MTLLLPEVIARKPKHGRQVTVQSCQCVGQDNNTADRDPVLLSDRTGAADSETPEQRNKVQHLNESVILSMFLRGADTVYLWRGLSL